MRAASHFVLDDDIVDRLLRFSQDFASLRAFALSCRTVYDVYRAHPKSITRAVAYGVVGPMLPQALQVIRNQWSDGPSIDDSIHVPPVDATTVIARHELDALEHNQDVVRQLEDMFSLRYRDLFQSTLYVISISTCAMLDTRNARRPPACFPPSSLCAFIVPCTISGYSNPPFRIMKTCLTTRMIWCWMPLAKCARVDCSSSRIIPHKTSMR